MRGNRIYFFMAFILCACVSSHAFELVVDGRARASIVLAADCSESERYAANELQRAVRIMTGTDLPLETITRHDPEKTGAIYLGTPQTHPSIAAQARVREQLATHQRSPGQNYVLLTDQGCVYLAGEGPIGALYATYDFLESLNIRWLWPGETGEFIPQQKTVRAPTLDVSRSPAFELRGFRGRYRREGGIWMARNRLNYGDRDLWRYEDIAYTIGFPNHWGGHSFGWIAPEDCPPVKQDRAQGIAGKLARDVYFEKYPEHFTLVKGERVLRQHCYSNPDVQAVFVDWIKRFWRDHPEVEVLALSPMDNPVFCECEACAQFGVDVSTRLHKFLHIVLDAVEKEFPNKQYRCFAYSVYKPSPSCKVHPALTIDYCMHDRCYKHLLDDPDCERNQTAVAALKQWFDHGVKRFTMYGYHYDAVRGPHSGFLMPLVPVLRDELQRLQQLGFVGFASEMAASPGIYEFSPENIWAANQIGVYLTGRLLWNPEADLEALLLDACTTAYGAAGSDMAAYEKLMWQAWMGPGHISGYFGNPARLADLFLPPETIARADEILAAATLAIKSAPPHPFTERHQANLTLAQDVYATWRNLATARFAWLDIASGKTADRGPALRTAPPDEELYRADYNTVTVGETPSELSAGCIIQSSPTNGNFIRIGKLPGDKLIFGNHPRFFKDSSNWINYETTFKFRYNQQDQSPNRFTLLTRIGGIRFNDDFRTIYVLVTPRQITVSLRERSGKVHRLENGSLTLESVGLPHLSLGQWHTLRVRNVDTRLFIWLHPENSDKEVLLGEITIPLGGGHINLNSHGGLDITSPEVRAVVNTP